MFQVMRVNPTTGERVGNRTYKTLDEAKQRAQWGNDLAKACGMDSTFKYVVRYA